MRIGITSYLPNNPEVKQRRKEANAKQIKWLHEIFPNKTIEVVAQNYADSDYLGAGFIRYSKHAQLGVSKARNMILKSFYESDDDFLLLLDDDVILYDYYGGKELLCEIEENPAKYMLFDRVTANNPRYLAFKKDNFKDKNVVTHWKLIRQPFNTGAPFCVYRNIRKYKGKQIYFTEPKGNEIFIEDVDFHIKWVMEGMTSFICTQWQLKEMSYAASTIYTTNRTEEEKEAVRRIISSYPFSEKLLAPNGRISWKYLNDKNATRKVGYIEREEAFEYTLKEIPR